MGELKLDKSRAIEAVDIEYGIRPPMNRAVTIPVSNGVVIYVCISAFGVKGEGLTAVDLLKVANALELKSEG